MTSTITSLQNPRIKAAIKLRQRRSRKLHGRFLIDGVREISRALASGINVSELFVCEPLLEIPSAAIVAQARQGGADVVEVTDQVMERLCFGDRAGCVLAVADTPAATLSSWRESLPSQPVVAILESLEKPGNVGAVLRTADAAGIDAVIATGQGTDLYNPNVIRASLGAVFTLNVCTSTTQEILTWLRQNRFAIIASRVDGAESYASVSLRAPVALVLGSESHGLSDDWRGDDIRAIKLPMLGSVDSLNVSTTAAVLFYEALRQRRNASH